MNASRPTLIARASLLAAVGLLTLAGCAPAESAHPEHAPTVAAGADLSLTGEITVYADASLRTAFDEITAAFSSSYPNATVAPIVYESSAALAARLQSGETADVVALAGEESIQSVIDAGAVTEAAPFAANTLVIAVPLGNPASADSLAALAGVRTALCAPEASCGTAATALLGASGVTLTPTSVDADGAAAVQKVVDGEADAAVVFASDVAGVDTVETIAPEGAEQASVRYAITGAPDAGDASQAFIGFVRSSLGQKILGAYGFGAP